MAGAAGIKAGGLATPEEAARDDEGFSDDDSTADRPQLPAVEEVVLNEVEPGSLLIIAARSDRTAGGAKRDGDGPTRHSRHAKIYGDHAELLVERRLKQLGKKGIRHCASERLGYDLEYKEGGRIVGVEVKGTPRQTFKNFELTQRELEAAERLGTNCELWLVANIRSRAASVEIIRNPHR